MPRLAPRLPRVSRRTALVGLAAAAPATAAVALLAKYGLDTGAFRRLGLRRRARRHQRRPSDLGAGWQRKVRDLIVRRLRPQHRATLPSGMVAAFELREAEVHHFPGWTDSNSPAYWHTDRLVLFNSAEQPVRSTGSSLETLSDPVDVACFPCDRPGGRWIEAVWPDPSTGILYGWYHFEPGDLTCLTAPIIGAALSHDGGLTWIDQGPVLENRYPIDCDYDNGFFVGGNGDFHVIPDREGRYFYFLFSNYAGPVEEQGVGIARGAFAGKGQPGTVNKYFRGEWREPGLGGRVTPLFPSTTGWKGPHVEAFWGPSVHWNEHLQRYVALLNHTDGAEWVQEGVYITFSPDLVRWSEPQKILDANEWYPQIMGVSAGGTETRAGQTARLYVGGVSTYELVFA